MFRHTMLILFFCFPMLFWAKDDEEKMSRKYRQEQLWALGAEHFLQVALEDSNLYSPLESAKLDTLYRHRGIHVDYSEEFAYHTLREQDLETIEQELRQLLALPKRKKLHITVDDVPLEQYVPLYYASKPKDKTRLQKPYDGPMNVVNISKPFTVSRGLDQRHIALWNSHGRYFNHEENRWKWQRAPMFTTVEDLFTSAYVLSFLTPMLENAGANVYLPRERDIQTNELIVDNADDGFTVQGEWVEMEESGFKSGVSLYASSVNPFKQGSYVQLKQGAEAQWTFRVPESGNYAVYVSYVSLEKSTDAASYRLIHSGDTTDFLVNQRMGGGTWIYLGHFYFDAGEVGQLLLSAQDKSLVTADALRLGGGMGSVPRGGRVSGVPRWQEAARYYLQYAGALDTLTFNLHGDTIDYNDDFRSRARWVNYLRGGESVEPSLRGDTILPGFGIPIDLSLGIHTDAGHFASLDTIVGTLAIYSSYDVAQNRRFYYGKSRMLNRDLADLVQSQIVEDVRVLYDSAWTKRELWDKMYSEATFAEVPSLLLELHGHANALDMRYGLDPQFRFDVSRSIYKGILRFLSTYYQEDYVVQPLPVSNMHMLLEEGQLWLSWTATEDVLEPSAQPEAYVVYRRKNAKAWDNGTLVTTEKYPIDVSDTALYSYKVTAVNSGGESFPSTILSTVHKNDSAANVLIVDAFTRTAAPFFIEEGDSVGVAPWEDEGVPYGLDIATIGWQYEYDQNIPWRTDDDPGHGGSFQNLSSTIFLGNNFDHSAVHAEAFAALGYNVVSTSISAVEQGLVHLEDYDLVDVIYGEQRSDVYPSGEVKHAIYSLEMMDELRAYLEYKKGKLLISGAHLANEIYADTSAQCLNERKAFARQVLGFDFGGEKREAGNIFMAADTVMFKYNVDYLEDQYRVENTDVLLPMSGAEIIYDYLDNDGAVIFYHRDYRVISSAIPFEAIKTKEKRVQLLEQCLEYMFD